MSSVYTILPTNLTAEQRRVARWISNRHRVAMGAVEQLVGVSFETAGTYRIDPYLLLAVISIESAFNPLAESPVGAVGLMQIMPKVHSAKLKSFGGQPLDPWVNLQVGASILREYIDRFGSEMEALKAEHAQALKAALETAAKGEPQQVLMLRLEIDELKKTITRLTPAREASAST